MNVSQVLLLLKQCNERIHIEDQLLRIVELNLCSNDNVSALLNVDAIVRAVCKNDPRSSSAALFLRNYGPSSSTVQLQQHLAEHLGCSSREATCFFLFYKDIVRRIVSKVHTKESTSKSKSESKTHIFDGDLILFERHFR